MSLSPCVHSRPSPRLVLEPRALCLQESRWLCCHLGPELPLYEGFPETCLPQIWSKQLCEGEGTRTLNWVRNPCILLPRGFPLEWCRSMMLSTSWCTWQQSLQLPDPPLDLPSCSKAVRTDGLTGQPYPSCVCVHMVHHFKSCAPVWLLCVYAQSCPTLCDPMGCSLPGSSVHGTSQARILEWVAISFSSRSSWSRNQTCISGISCFSTVPPGKPPVGTLTRGSEAQPGHTPGPVVCLCAARPSPFLGSVCPGFRTKLLCVLACPPDSCFRLGSAARWQPSELVSPCPEG